MKGKGKTAEQPDLDVGSSRGNLIELTNEMRAELVALTGHDIAADDPVMVLVVLNQLLLPRIAREVAEQMRAANVDTAEALAKNADRNAQIRDRGLALAGGTSS